MSHTPPTAPSAKILYDEGDTHGGLTFLMFLLGFSLGAFLHAGLYPDGGSPLIELPAFLMSGNDEELDQNSTIVEEMLLVNENDKNNSTDEPANCGDHRFDSFRLPKSIKPINYDLTLQPNLTTNVVDANVKIKLEVVEETEFIILHAEYLKIKKYSIIKDHTNLSAEFLPCSFVTQWSWKLNEKLKINDVLLLSIDYQFKMRSDLQGLYVSTHVDADGVKTKSAATQFEPTFARKMLPCFDEPNFKATFEVAIIREPHHVARSNMPLQISKEYNEDGLMKDVFEKSVKMSTYLLAIAVLDKYDNVKRYTRNTQKPIEVRLYAPEDVINGQYEFGLDTTIRALEFFESYFNISYPLEKIDLLALDDFSEGAMENWGLVTFRDSALLFDENKASVVAKESIALIICHEIAHQWFGNLVTMDWWNEVFLNEGFANYMEYLCVDELFPDWNIMTRFYAENVAISQDLDGYLSSRAIDSTGDNNLMNLFDAINYHKAAAIIHMIADMAGFKNFQKALVEYLNKYAYDNTKGEELWRIVEKHSNNPVAIPSVATSYIAQVGYPLIHLEVTNESRIIIHNQTRFLFIEGEPVLANRVPQSWPIPIRYRTKDDDESKLHWMRADEESAAWDIPNGDDWLIANTGGVGYFKVKYDKSMYRKLTNQLKTNHTMISPIDRTMLINDAYDLSRTSLLEIETYMDLIEYAKVETEKMAWSIILKNLRTIESLIEETDHVHLFRDFERALILKAYESFEWDEKSTTPNTKGLQIEITNNACRLRIKHCSKQAYLRYQKWANEGTRFPNQQGVILAEGIRQGGDSAWEKIWSAYAEATSPSDRIHIITALAATKDASLINRLLKYCIDGKIKQNLIPRVFSCLSATNPGRTTAWRFFKLNYDKFRKIFGNGSPLLVACIRCLSENLSTTEDLEELKSFLKEKRVDSDLMKTDLAFEEIVLNIQWRSLNEKKLGKWLKNWDDRHRTLSRR
ncbi:unnamed protein product [Caenorhabditis bovis]|uniref:Aminopeptidase n=1 Tax=Caenorhabditis bovis TaxID=2654633 RepID=A0A8S1F861_9PELO|nr:unnamed protein product [Caenorhabditis bovis]